MYNICIVLILIASILLILAVLVQSPKSGMAANFGAANQVMGVRESANILEKTSWWLAGIIAALSILATVAIDGGTTTSAMAEDAKAFAAKQTTPIKDVQPIPQAEIPTEGTEVADQE